MTTVTPPLVRAARRTTRQASPHVEGDCLIYGSTTPDGYGVIKIATGQRGGRTVLLHRLAYETLVGPIPDGLELDHRCRNRACYNTDHLEPVTPSVNQQRGAAAKPLCPAGHVRTPDPTRPGQTRCKPCRQESDRRRYARQRSAA